MGFLTSHSVLTNTFEYSLQLINPKLTLPYWDWTIEELDAERESVDGEIVIKSPLFQESWFGTADPDDYMVSEAPFLNNYPMLYTGNYQPNYVHSMHPLLSDEVCRYLIVLANRSAWAGLPSDYVVFQVKDSRWAYTKIPSMYDGNPGDLIPDVYGRLRSRWNVNSSP